MSWIHIRDLIEFINLAVNRTDMTGTYNLTAPKPCRFLELHESLVSIFGGIGFLKIPKIALNLALGERASVFLMSQRVVPKRLIEQGFTFKYSEIWQALQNLCGEHFGGAHSFYTKQWIPRKRSEVWTFFSSETNLERITPPWLHFRVLKKSTTKMQSGTIIDYQLTLHGINLNWQSQIKDWQPEASQFTDIQLRGPYKVWHHQHIFEALGGGTLMTDWVKYKLPFSVIGELAGSQYILKDVHKIFTYRRKIISELFI